VIFTLDSYHIGDERDSKTHLRCQYLVSEMSGKLHNLLADSFFIPSDNGGLSPLGMVLKTVYQSTLLRLPQENLTIVVWLKRFTLFVFTYTKHLFTKMST
jgi:hypothetical protein